MFWSYERLVYALVYTQLMKTHVVKTISSAYLYREHDYFASSFLISIYDKYYFIDEQPILLCTNWFYSAYLLSI